ncbi:MAG: DUF4834 family protein [Bacteroidales bacterium]|nr:DUF4834 family protein [Bacteroidales bacterium]
MLKFLLIIILFFFLLVFLLGFSFLRFLARMFGMTPPPRPRKDTSSRKEYKNNQRDTQTAHTSSRKKIFDKDQGEYTDYEEIK